MPTTASTTTSSSTSTSTTTTTTTPPTTQTTTAPTTTPTVSTTSAPTTVAPTTTRATTTTVVTTTTRPPATSPSVAVWKLRTTSKVISLTFDAGSDLGYTDLVLDTLAAKHVQASFGITGKFAEAHPERVRRMAREGHVVMNHSYSHYSFTGVSSTNVLLSATARQADLRKADAIIAPLIGRSTVPYWRPPYGDIDTGVLRDAGAIGYSWTVMWTFDSLGWRGISADQIVSRVLERAEPGAIVVMHVGSQSQDGPALARVIDGLRALGYSFTTVYNGIR